MTEIKPKEIGGLFYYPSKPDKIRVAKKEDFFKNGLPKFGMWYLIYGYHDKTYDAQQVNKNFDIKKIEPWLNDNRVFVKED